MKLTHNFGCFGDETNFNQLEDNEGIEIIVEGIDR
jgi:hypothetical protein